MRQQVDLPSKALLWSLAAMPALVLAYLFAPPVMIAATALASGAFAVFVILRTVALLRKQELNERRFTSLVLHSSDLVTVMDANATIRYLSPSVERMLGYDSTSLEGTSFAELIDPDQASRVLEFILDGARGAHSSSSFGVATAAGSKPRRCARICSTIQA